MGGRVDVRAAVVRRAIFADLVGFVALLVARGGLGCELHMPGVSGFIGFSLFALLLMAGGLALVLRGQAVGLLLALSAAWLVVLSVGPLLLGPSRVAAVALLATAGPGVLLTFLALGLYARAAVRFLRGSTKSLL